MPSIEFRRFNRNVVLTRLMLATSIMSALVCVPHFAKGNIGLAACWLAIASIWFTNFVWSKSTPVIEITNDAITMRMALARKPVVIPWNAIKEVKRISLKKITLVLNAGKKINIDLFAINKNQRDVLVAVVHRALQRNP